jgi:hypothetical protein
MKVAIIGSSQYRKRFLDHHDSLVAKGHEVRLPALDSKQELDELGLCEYNRKAIEWADEVHVVWDQRSVGTLFDFGMAFALRKRVRVVYWEPKTFPGVMKKYEAWCESVYGE